MLDTRKIEREYYEACGETVVETEYEDFAEMRNKHGYNLPTVIFKNDNAYLVMIREEINVRFCSRGVEAYCESSHGRLDAFVEYIHGDYIQGNMEWSTNCAIVLCATKKIQLKNAKKAI